MKVKPFGKPKHYTRNSFHKQCVRYVKSRQHGFIHPRDTSYAGLAVALESFAGSTSIGSFVDRCREAAFKIGFVVQARPVSRVENSSIRQKQPRCRVDRNKFYQSLEWKKLRYATLKKYGGKCQCCGVSSEDTQLHVDHIKPISKYWALRLDPDNVQVLCRDCNWGKLNIDQTDWRGKRVLWDDKWPD